ncbi:MAG TPA: TetR/AcrR family transcriptional regulator C-terminal domain-containing protein [Burkholderiaceae bacterium]|nr:TetR/AcrR family transcriptional regulator C-terminal domain-containing protein [Burkholderiaceae bacterium]
MRSRLLDAATALFMARGLQAVTVAQVAEACEAYPSQVTYYFRSKDAMFVEAACRQMLHLAREVEERTRETRSAGAYRDALVEGALGRPGLALFLEALALARHRPALQPLVARTIERLHVEGERAFAQARRTNGWRVASSDSVVARRFWALVMAVGLRDGALGVDVEASKAEVRALLTGDFADAPLHGEARRTAPRLPPSNERPETIHGRRRTR